MTARELINELTAALAEHGEDSEVYLSSRGAPACTPVLSVGSDSGLAIYIRDFAP